MPKDDFNELLTWATVREREYIEAIEKHGSLRRASEKMGVARASIHSALQSLRKRAAMKGYSPAHDMTKTVPDGYIVKGVSTYYDKDGEKRGQWVKSAIDQLRQDTLARIAAETMAQQVKGMAPIVAPPARVNENLMTVYPLGDPHFGLYTWAKECGDDFDLKIARRLTLGAVDRLVQSSPASHTALILPLGDVFHMNDQTNQTPAHKHQLDVDSRFVHVLQVGIETFRHAVLRALEKHQRVVVRFVQGNHDPQAVWALAFTVSAYFHDEPRVEVDLSPAKHWYFRFGQVLIGSVHGDTTKAEQLPGVMAADRARDWGETLYRYWYCGHVHHSSVKEFPGVTVETFRTLAASDAHAAGHGYRAGRDMRAIVMDKRYGEIERHRCDVAMLEEEAAEA